MPDREERLGALVDIVEAVGGPAPPVLDLACGTGVDLPPAAGPPAGRPDGGGRRRPALLAIAEAASAPTTG